MPNTRSFVLNSLRNVVDDVRKRYPKANITIINSHINAYGQACAYAECDDGKVISEIEKMARVAA